MTKETKIILPGETGERQGEDSYTERGKERDQEEKDFVPVILKRSDEALRHPDDILEHAINLGQEQLERPVFSLFISSIAGGLAVGFSAMAVGILSTLTIGYGEALIPRILIALVYPIGFIICIISGSQLFTEHTSTAVYPVLDKRSKMGTLLKLWATVITGNLLGAVIMASLLNLVDEVVGAREGYILVADHLVHFGTIPFLVSSLLAGWLMALAAWLILAAHSTISQMACIYMVTFLIAIGGLHHSIAGSAEIFTAYMMSDTLLFSDVAGFVILCLAGNLAGGSIFVALLNYAHIRQTQLQG